MNIDIAIEITKKLLSSANRVPIDTKIIFIDIDSIVSTILYEELKEDIVSGHLVNKMDDMLTNSLRELVSSDKIYVASFRSKQSFLNEKLAPWQTNKDKLRKGYAELIGRIYDTYMLVFRHMPNGILINTKDIDTFYVPIILNEYRNLSTLPKLIISKDPMALIALEKVSDNFTVCDTTNSHTNLMNNTCKRLIPMENNMIVYYLSIVGHKYHLGIRGIGKKNFAKKISKMDVNELIEVTSVFTTDYLIENHKESYDNIIRQIDEGLNKED